MGPGDDGFLARGHKALAFQMSVAPLQCFPMSSVAIARQGLRCVLLPLATPRTAFGSFSKMATDMQTSYTPTFFLPEGRHTRTHYRPSSLVASGSLHDPPFEMQPWLMCVCTYKNSGSCDFVCICDSHLAFVFADLLQLMDSPT